MGDEMIFFRVQDLQQKVQRQNDHHAASHSSSRLSKRLAITARPLQSALRTMLQCLLSDVCRTVLAVTSITDRKKHA